MPDNVNLYTFPSEDAEALALFYVQRKSTPMDSPEQLYAMYRDAYQRIRAERRKHRDRVTE